MKSLVLLAVLGVCSAVPAVLDTPEVQAEKARFFQAYRAAQAAAIPQQAIHHGAPVHGVYRAAAPVQPKWTGPVAATVPAGVDGTITPVSNTAEVSAATNAFLNAYRQQVVATVGTAPSFQTHAPTYSHGPAYSHVPAVPQYQPRWTGPVAATVPAGVDGTITPVSDTAEVSAARNTFLNAYRQQVAATVGAVSSFQAHAPTYSHIPAVPQYQPKWTGPVAATIPAGLPGSTSQVADTPEVAAAKQQFFSTFQRQAAAAAAPSVRYY